MWPDLLYRRQVTASCRVRAIFSTIIEPLVSGTTLLVGVIAIDGLPLHFPVFGASPVSRAAGPGFQQLGVNNCHDR